MSANIEVMSDSDDSMEQQEPIHIVMGPAEFENMTETLKKQYETEDSITSLFEQYYLLSEAGNFNLTKLHKDRHVAYLRKGLFAQGGVSSGLYASQVWVVYWCLHGLSLLESLPSPDECSRIVAFLRQCRNEDGGFGGGFGQISHLAPTYAAVLSAAIIGTEEAYELIDKEKLYAFILSMKNENGSFRMHDGGEVDVRASYIAMVCASLTGKLTSELRDKVSDFVGSCQSYEGGIGAVPGAEAHGGYTFCGLAAVKLLDETHLLDLFTLTHWAVHRQMSVEGGFQGRTNKLVDGCYSFWQGAVFPILDEVYVSPDLYQQNSENQTRDQKDGSWLCDQRSLQQYILIAGQRPSGGLRDKPSQSPDYYHSCYVLSGLSIVQHNAQYAIPQLLGMGLPGDIEAANIILPTHPVYNITHNAVQAMKQRFSNP